MFVKTTMQERGTDTPLVPTKVQRWEDTTWPSPPPLFEGQCFAGKRCVQAPPVLGWESSTIVGAAFSKTCSPQGKLFGHWKLGSLATALRGLICSHISGARPVTSLHPRPSPTSQFLELLGQSLWKVKGSSEPFKMRFMHREGKDLVSCTALLELRLTQGPRRWWDSVFCSLTQPGCGSKSKPYRCLIPPKGNPERTIRLMPLLFHMKSRDSGNREKQLLKVSPSPALICPDSI